VAVLSFRRILVLCGLSGILLVAAAPEGQAKSGTPITACGQLVTTNAFLTANLLCTGSGVVVGASGITIDLKGFMLRGSGAYYGIDDPGYDRVTVKNGVLRNFDVGVYAYDGADEVRVSDLLASGNFSGVYIVGNEAWVKSSAASANGPGIYVQGESARVEKATAVGNQLSGISIVGDAASVRSSTASGNGGDGIVVAGDAALIKSNRAEANGFSGGASDGAGLGIEVVNGSFTTPPAGTNVARGNDAPNECIPASLC
jgi:hypothetical protein